MRVGSLFSGGGLGDFGLMAAGIEIAWQCEIDDYCQNILALRYPESKKYKDIKELKGNELEPVDIITGGFPCQPFSVAGKQRGKDDNRYLWPEMLRVIAECRPRWVVGENVPGIINLALDTVCSDLEAKGYEVRQIVFPAHALGAHHKRDRLWIVGHSGLFGQAINEKQTAGIEQSGKDVANTGCEYEQGNTEKFQTNKTFRSTRNLFTESSSSRQSDADPADTRIERMCQWSIDPFDSYWQTEPAVGRVANGVADRVHRLKMLGNGQVPACTYVIGMMIQEIEKGIN